MTQNKKIPDIYLLYFVYTTPFITVGNAATVSTTLQIIADSDFQANYVTIAVRQSDVIVNNWGGTIQINDSSKGRELFNQQIAVASLAGNGQLPYPFNPPRLFRRNTSVVITLSNNVATVTEVQVSFHGNKIMPSTGN